MIHSHGYQSDRHIPMFDWPTEGGHCRKENPAILECLYGLQVQRYERGQQKFTAKVLQLKENITYALQTAQIWVNGGLATHTPCSCITGIVMATPRTACFYSFTKSHITHHFITLFSQWLYMLPDIIHLYCASCSTQVNELCKSPQFTIYI